MEEEEEGGWAVREQIEAGKEMSESNGQADFNQEKNSFSSFLSHKPTRREKKKEGREEGTTRGKRVRREEDAGKKKAKRRKVGDEAERGSLHICPRGDFFFFFFYLIHAILQDIVTLRMIIERRSQG